MILQAVTTSSATLAHGAHHFTVALSDLQPDSGMLLSPVMTCTECPWTAQTGFPLLGDANAQLVHAQWRVATNAQPDLAASIQSVIADVTNAGGTPAITEAKVP